MPTGVHVLRKFAAPAARLLVHCLANFDKTSDRATMARGGRPDAEAINMRNPFQSIEDPHERAAAVVALIGSCEDDGDDGLSGPNLRWITDTFELVDVPGLGKNIVRMRTTFGSSVGALMLERKTKGGEFFLTVKGQSYGFPLVDHNITAAGVKVLKKYGLNGELFVTLAEIHDRARIIVNANLDFFRSFPRRADAVVSAVNILRYNNGLGAYPIFKKDVKPIVDAVLDKRTTRQSDAARNGGAGAGAGAGAKEDMDEDLVENVDGKENKGSGGDFTSALLAPRGVGLPVPSSSQLAPLPAKKAGKRKSRREMQRERQVNAIAQLLARMKESPAGGLGSDAAMDVDEGGGADAGNGAGLDLKTFAESLGPKFRLDLLLALAAAEGGDAYGRADSNENDNDPIIRFCNESDDQEIMPTKQARKLATTSVAVLERLYGCSDSLLTPMSRKEKSLLKARILSVPLGGGVGGDGGGVAGAAGGGANAAPNNHLASPLAFLQSLGLAALQLPSGKALFDQSPSQYDQFAIGLRQMLEYTELSHRTVVKMFTTTVFRSGETAEEAYMKRLRQKLRPMFDSLALCMYHLVAETKYEEQVMPAAEPIGKLLGFTRFLPSTKTLENREEEITAPVRESLHVVHSKTNADGEDDGYGLHGCVVINRQKIVEDMLRDKSFTGSLLRSYRRQRRYREIAEEQFGTAFLSSLGPTIGKEFDILTKIYETTDKLGILFFEIIRMADAAVMVAMSKLKGGRTLHHTRAVAKILGLPRHHGSLIPLMATDGNDSPRAFDLFMVEGAQRDLCEWERGVLIRTNDLPADLAAYATAAFGGAVNGLFFHDAFVGGDGAFVQKGIRHKPGKNWEFPVWSNDVTKHEIHQVDANGRFVNRAPFRHSGPALASLIKRVADPKTRKTMYGVGAEKEPRVFGGDIGPGFTCGAACHWVWTPGKNLNEQPDADIAVALNLESEFTQAVRDAGVPIYINDVKKLNVQAGRAGDYCVMHEDAVFGPESPYGRALASANVDAMIHKASGEEGDVIPGRGDVLRRHLKDRHMMQRLVSEVLLTEDFELVLALVHKFEPAQAAFLNATNQLMGVTKPTGFIVRDMAPRQIWRCIVRGLCPSAMTQADLEYLHFAFKLLYKPGAMAPPKYVDNANGTAEEKKHAYLCKQLTNLLCRVYSDGKRRNSTKLSGCSGAERRWTQRVAESRKTADEKVATLLRKPAPAQQQPQQPQAPPLAGLAPQPLAAPDIWGSKWDAVEDKPDPDTLRLLYQLVKEKRDLYRAFAEEQAAAQSAAAAANPAPAADRPTIPPILEQSQESGIAVPAERVDDMCRWFNCNLWNPEKGHIDVCRKCGFGGKLTRCDWCNMAYHLAGQEKRGRGDCEGVGADPGADQRFACPLCVQEAVENFEAAQKKFDGNNGAGGGGAPNAAAIEEAGLRGLMSSCYGKTASHNACSMTVIAVKSGRKTLVRTTGERGLEIQLNVNFQKGGKIGFIMTDKRKHAQKIAGKGKQAFYVDVDLISTLYVCPDRDNAAQTVIILEAAKYHYKTAKYDATGSSKLDETPTAPSMLPSVHVKPRVTVTVSAEKFAPLYRLLHIKFPRLAEKWITKVPAKEAASFNLARLKSMCAAQAKKRGNHAIRILRNFAKGSEEMTNTTNDYFDAGEWDLLCACEQDSKVDHEKHGVRVLKSTEAPHLECISGTASFGTMRRRRATEEAKRGAAADKNAMKE